MNIEEISKNVLLLLKIDALCLLSRRYKTMKEEAVRNQDFLEAAKYREMEKDVEAKIDKVADEITPMFPDL